LSFSFTYLASINFDVIVIFCIKHAKAYKQYGLTRFTREVTDCKVYATKHGKKNIPLQLNPSPV